MKHYLYLEFEDDTFVCAECGCDVCTNSTDCDYSAKQKHKIRFKHEHFKKNQQK